MVAPASQGGPESGGCCDVLRADHRRTEVLLDELADLLSIDALSINALSEDPLHQFKAAFETLQLELLRHYALEERALFPVLSMYRPMVLMEVEHEDLQSAEQGVWAALQTVESTKFGDAAKLGESVGFTALKSAFATLDERLRAHIVEEDRGIFPLAESAPEPEEQALIRRKLAEHAAELATVTDIKLLRPEPVIEITAAPLFSRPSRPIDYQTLFEAEHDSLRLIRLQAGQELRPHWSAEYQCLLMLSGTATLKSAGREDLLEAGHQIRLSPRSTFGVLAQTDVALLAFRVWPRPNYLRS